MAQVQPTYSRDPNAHTGTYRFPVSEPREGRYCGPVAAVEVWYDVYTRLWTIFTVTAEGFQADPAEYESSKADAFEMARSLI